MTFRASGRLWVMLAMVAGLAWLVATDPQRAPTPAVAELPPRKPGVAAAPQQSGTAGQERAPSLAVRDPIPREQLIPARKVTSTATDLFASRNWAPPPAPVAPAPAVLAPPPVPPPAFTYLGKRRDEQGWQVYLGRGELALIVREGDSVEGGYRVESIKPPVLTLARADGKQQIAIGEWE